MSERIVITAASAVTPEGVMENPVVVVEDGRIAEVASRGSAEVPASARRLDFPGALIAPGLVDIHIHGCAGHDAMSADAAAFAAMGSFLVRHGVTSYVPTTLTATMDRTLAALERLGKAVRAGGIRGQARPRGIHLEGPFISTEKCGAHPIAEIVPPSRERFERMWAAAGGAIRMITLAPEVDGAVEFTRDLVARGVRVSLGHSDAAAEETKAAIVAGASHATHTFNAMRALDHRKPGIVGTALTDDRLSADIIADGVHLSPEIVSLFVRCKGGERAVLITDAISATGMPEGKYRLGEVEVEVANGRCMRNGRLAGSVLTLDRAVRNVIDFAGLPLERAIRLATSNAARAAGLDCGALREGGDADLVVLSPGGEVMQCFAHGQAVFN